MFLLHEAVCIVIISIFGLQVSSKHVEKSEDYDYSWAIDSVNRTQIREYLKELAKEPHLAGLERDEALAAWIKEQWESIGLDEVRLEGYKLLLDYPDNENPNYLRIYDSSDNQIWQSHYKEEGVDDPNFVNAFNAYSKNGVVKADPVYVNYGTIEDFEWLQANQTDIMKGKICLARYGQIFRGNKAENAANFGCIGLAIFMDPSGVAQEGTDPENILPNKWWMPGTAVQRGSLALADGDPETPNWPSLDHVYRLDREDRAEYLPSIPVQPIGYSDAYEVLRRMDGIEAPDSWQGGLNLTYVIGGLLTDDHNNGAKLEIEVNNKLEEKVSSNVIGVIYGSEEPDRYVMFGNHRDAWGFGALDPNSGTAQMMEVARVLGERKKSGWRPRRTIMFLSWGAEEYSLCGSREFVEQYEMEVSDRGVAYINTDVCLSGPILEPVASPTLMDLMVPATKDVQSPFDDNLSYYEYWKKWSEEGESFDPEVSPFVGAGSDHATFIFYAGVPVMDIMFQEDRKLYPKIGGYPAYHTGFETFELVDTLYDQNFTIFRACAQLNLRLGLELAESSKLPLKMANYATIMEEGVETLDKNGVIKRLNDLGIETTYFNESVVEFRIAAEDFDFVALNNDYGLPDRIQYRHVVSAPSLFDAYGGSAFPGIGDLLYKLDQVNDLNSQEYKNVIKQIKKHVSDLMIIIKRAAHYLQPVIPSTKVVKNNGTYFQSSLFLISMCIVISLFNF